MNHWRKCGGDIICATLRNVFLMLELQFTVTELIAISVVLLPPLNCEAFSVQLPAWEQICCQSQESLKCHISLAYSRYSLKHLKSSRLMAIKRLRTC